MTRRPAAIPAASLLLLFVTRTAAAHAFDPAVLELRVLPGARVELALRLPAALAARPDTALRPRLPAGCRVVEQVTEHGARLDCAGAAAELAFGVDGLDEAQAEVIAHAVLPDGSERAAALHGDRDVLRLPGPEGAAPLGPGAVLAGYLRLGARHILCGFDHLAFLAGLVLLVGGLGSLVRTVTAFTVAHGLTVVLAATTRLALPQPPVEALIAASILLVARELLVPPRAPGDASLLRRAPALSALGFGLLHGLGFASALAEAGLPPRHVPLALLGFNLGVEAGQLAVVALLVVPLRALLRVRTAQGSPSPWATRLPAYALGAVATAWLLARLGLVVGAGSVA